MRERREVPMYAMYVLLLLQPLFITLHCKPFTPERLQLGLIDPRRVLRRQCRQADYGDDVKHGRSEAPPRGGRCINGKCVLENGRPRCICGNLFFGARCQFIDFKQVSVVVIGPAVILRWTRPPRLRYYSFIYFELGNLKHPREYGRLEFKQITMKDSEDAVLIGHLNSTGWRYRVCILPTSSAEILAETQAIEMLTNSSYQINSQCIDVKTGADLHTFLGYVIAILLSLVALSLMYAQRLKIEILYSGKSLITKKEVANSHILRLLYTKSNNTVNTVNTIGLPSR